MQQVKCANCDIEIKHNDIVFNYNGDIIHANPDCIMGYCGKKNVTIKCIESFRFKNKPPLFEIDEKTLSLFLIGLFFLNFIAIIIVFIATFITCMMGDCNLAFNIVILLLLILPGIPKKIMGKDNLWYYMWRKKI